MRKYLVALLALSAFAVPSSALAQAPGPPDVPPALAPPTPGPVTDPASAGVVAKAYAVQHAGQFLDQQDGRNRRRVRVTDADAACLQSPFLDSRFGCVFTLKVLVISRNRGWDDWGRGDSRSHPRARSAGDGGHGHKRHDRNHQEHFRVRRYGCLGGLTIDAGPPPSVQLKFVECQRIHGGRDDFQVDETVTPAT